MAEEGQATEGEYGGGRCDWQSGKDLKRFGSCRKESTIFQFEKKKGLHSKKLVISREEGSLAMILFENPREFCRRLRQRCQRIEEISKVRRLMCPSGTMF